MLRRIKRKYKRLKKRIRRFFLKVDYSKSDKIPRYINNKNNKRTIRTKTNDDFYISELWMIENNFILKIKEYMYKGEKLEEEIEIQFKDDWLQLKDMEGQMKIL